MSTLNRPKKNAPVLPPKWTKNITEYAYRQDATAGRYLSSSMLREFQLCPAGYQDIVAGGQPRPRTHAMRVGYAAHKLILEGSAAYKQAFIVGGPVNRHTGKCYAATSKAFDRWIEENGFRPQGVVTPGEHETILKMRDAALNHREIAMLLGVGWAERSARASLHGMPCQIRLDWLRPDNLAVELKTIADIDRFEQDARNFGYLSQLAFYRDVAEQAGAGELEMVAVVLEKKPPFRAGVWRFAQEVLQPYSEKNRQGIERLALCRSANSWPTGYEQSRAFPPAGMPRVWLN